MARSKTSFRVYAEALPVLALLRALKGVPPPWAERLIALFLRFIFACLPSRRKITQRNIQRCFPDWTAAQRAALEKKSVQHLARGMAAFIHMEEELRKPALENVRVEGEHHLKEALAKGRGVIAFNAHYGCWEMSSAATMKAYPQITAGIYRPLDNPMLDEEVRRIRCASFGHLIPRRQALRESIPWLRKNGILGIIVDQNFAAGGVYVDFFGHLAATTPIVSILSQRTGAAVLPVHSRWESDHLKIIWEAPLQPSTYPDPKDACADDTQRMTQA